MEYYVGGWLFWAFVILIIVWGYFTWLPHRSYRQLSTEHSFPPFYYYGSAFSAEKVGDKGKFRGVGPKDYRRNDQRIWEDVNDQLMMSPDLDPSDLTVDVRNGEVTLHGTVRNRSHKKLAEHLADLIPGVRDVKNELVVRSPLSLPEESPA